MPSTSHWTSVLRQRELSGPSAETEATTGGLSRLMLCRRLSCLSRDEFRSIGPVPNVLHPNPYPPTYSMGFCPVSGFQQVLAIANEDGNVSLQDTSKPRRDARTAGLMKGFRAHNNACFDLAWKPGDPRKVVTVSADQTAKSWDISSGRFKAHKVFEGHTRSIKVVDFDVDTPDVFFTGGRDNVVRAWDLRTGKCENAIFNAHGDRPAAGSSGSPSSSRRQQRTTRHKRIAGSSGKTSSSSPSSPSPMSDNRPPPLSGTITALRHASDNRLLSCGDKDGSVKVWDMRRTYSHYQGHPKPAHRFVHPGDTGLKGFTSLLVDGRFAYASCVDSRVYQWDLHTLRARPILSYVGCDITSFFARISLSADGGLMACGSKDCSVYLWDVRRAILDARLPSDGEMTEQSPLAELKGHEAEVTCVAWCRSPEAEWRLATCADDDVKHRLWELGDREELDEGSTDVVGWAEVSQDAFGPSAGLAISSESCFFDLLEARRSHDGGGGGLEAASRPLSALLSSPSKQRPGPSTSTVTADLPCSPRKFNVTPRKDAARPRKLTISPRKATKKRLPFSSPTCNLPNLVRDGAPSRVAVTATKRRDRPSLLAWLGKATNAVEAKDKEQKENKRESSERACPRAQPKGKKRKLDR